MAIRLIDVVGEQTINVSQVAVTSAYGSAGQSVTSAIETSAVRLKNWNSPFYGIEYQIASGSWIPLGGGMDTTLSIDLSETTLKVRRSEFAPALITLDVEMNSVVGDPTHIVVSPDAPSDADGRPDGTIFIQVGEGLSIKDDGAYEASGGGGGGSISDRPLRMVGFGDSNMRGNGGLYTSLCEMVAARANGKIHLVYNAGVSGETSAQVAGRFHRDAGAKRADIFLVQIGTNDSNDSAVIVPVLTNMVSAARTMYPNCYVVVCSTFPNTGFEAAGIANAAAISSYVSALGDSKVIYAPTFEALDTAGDWTAGYNVDGVHANAVGTRAAADVVLTALSGVLATANQATPNKYNGANAANWLKNGTFSIGAPVGGMAAGWTLGNGGGWTASIDSSDTDIVGSAQVLTSGASNVNAPYLSMDTSAFSWATLAGRRMWVSFKVKHTYPTDATPSYALDFIPLTAELAGTKQGSTQITRTHNSGHDVWHFYRYEFIAPSIVSGVSSLNWALAANASATEGLVYRFAELDWGFADEMQPAFPTVQTIMASKTHNWPSLAAGAFQTTTVTATGAQPDGDCARATVSVSLGGTILFAQVTNYDEVTVTQWNPTGGAVDVANAYLHVWVDQKPF